MVGIGGALVRIIRGAANGSDLIFALLISYAAFCLPWSAAAYLASAWAGPNTVGLAVAAATCVATATFLVWSNKSVHDLPALDPGRKGLLQVRILGWCLTLLVPFTFILTIVFALRPAIDTFALMAAFHGLCIVWLVFCWTTWGRAVR